MRIGRSLLIFSAALFFGCATVPKPAAVEVLSPDELRIRLGQTAGLLKDFSAEGSITVNTPTMNQSAGFDLIARGSDSVKMSVYGPFGITVGTALFTRNEFTAYNALNNTVYRGSPEKQMRMLPFIKEIPFELLIGSLQGIHPLRVSSPIDSVELNADDAYSFTCSYEDGSFDKFEYKTALHRVTRCTHRSSGGEIQWSVKYLYKRGDDGSIVPEQVEVDVPSKETVLQLEYDSITYGTPSAALIISFPDDAEIITIE